MTSTIDLAPIMRLSVPERIEVVQTILDSIAETERGAEGRTGSSVGEI